MKDLLVIATMGIVFYIVYCIAAKQPIIRTKKNLEKAKQKNKAKQQEITAQQHMKILDEIEPLLMDELFDSLVDIREGILCLQDDWFAKIVEVTPVNYYLKDKDEQNQIDAQTEAWFAQLDHIKPRILIQNRFIDITENIQMISHTYENNQDALPPLAQEYAKHWLADLNHFQSSNSRFDTKYFIVFDYEVKKSDLRLEEGDSVFDEAFKKAQAELNRHIKKAMQLTKAGIHITPLDTVGITELHYHHFQRRRARKLRFSNVLENETLSLYVTGQQPPEKMILVKEKIDAEQVAEKERDKEYQAAL